MTHPIDIDEKSDITNRDGVYTPRTIHQHQTALLILADQKANILIGTIAVVLTILFTNFHNLIQLSDSIRFFALGFLLLEAIAMLLSLMVIMPRNTRISSEMAIHNIPNPLYFGLFINYQEDEFAEHIKTHLSTNLSSRNLLARDIYQIGQILNKKYLLLRYAYFMAVSGILMLALTAILTTFFK